MTTTAAALKVHALAAELDAIEAKAVAEARDLTPDEAERVDDQVVAEGPLRTQPRHIALAGEGLSIGRVVVHQPLRERLHRARWTRLLT
jgi:hypothetical protein